MSKIIRMVCCALLCWEHIIVLHRNFGNIYMSPESHNEQVLHPTMHYFETEMCIYVHVLQNRVIIYAALLNSTKI